MCLCASHHLMGTAHGQSWPVYPPQMASQHGNLPCRQSHRAPCSLWALWLQPTHHGADCCPMHGPTFTCPLLMWHQPNFASAHCSGAWMAQTNSYCSSHCLSPLGILLHIVPPTLTQQARSSPMSIHGCEHMQTEYTACGMRMFEHTHTIHVYVCFPPPPQHMDTHKR